MTLDPIAEITVWLRQPEPTSLRTAVDRLSQLSEDEAKDVVLALIQDTDPKVRSQSILVAAMWNSEIAQQLALKSIADPDWCVRLTSIDVLTKLRSPIAIETALGLLQFDQDEEVRCRAALYLGVVGSSAEIESLRDCCNSNSAANFEGTPIQEIAARAIGRIEARIIEEKSS